MRYVIFEWLAIVVMVPFDLDTIDTKLENDQTLLQKLVKQCEIAISTPGPNRDTSSIVLGKLLT